MAVMAAVFIASSKGSLLGANSTHFSLLEALPALPSVLRGMCVETLMPVSSFLSLSSTLLVLLVVLLVVASALAPSPVVASVELLSVVLEAALEAVLEPELESELDSGAAVVEVVVAADCSPSV